MLSRCCRFPHFTSPNFHVFGFSFSDFCLVAPLNLHFLTPRYFTVSVNVDRERCFIIGFDFSIDYDKAAFERFGDIRRFSFQLLVIPLEAFIISVFAL